MEARAHRADATAYAELKRRLAQAHPIEVSDSLLSKHLRTLEDAGYVHVRKGYEGKRPRTWLALTDEGTAAFARYRAALARLTST